MLLQPYNRQDAVEYTHRWSRRMNPEYPCICSESGNSTNFASQCLMAGCGKVECDRWNYRGGCTEAWVSPEALRRYLTDFEKQGPFAVEVYPWALEPGDIAQVYTEDGYWRSLVAVSNTAGKVEVAAHSYQVDYRPLDRYRGRMFCLHILGVRGK